MRSPEVGRVYRGRPDADSGRASTMYRVCVKVTRDTVWLAKMGCAESPELMKSRRNRVEIRKRDLNEHWEPTGYVLESATGRGEGGAR